MKNNILLKFAINDLKNHKKDSIITMITIFIVSIIVMLISLFTPYFTNDDYVKYLNTYGYYSHSIAFYDSDDKKQLEEGIYKIDNQEYRLNDLKHCWLYEYGKTLQGDSMNVLEGDSSVLTVRLLEGNMPANENEIAIKASVLNKWGYEEKLGVNAKFSFNSYKDADISYVIDDDISYEIYNESLDIREFKVVGILNEQYQSPIIVGDRPTKLFHLYLYSGLNEKTNDYYPIDNADEYKLIPALNRDNFYDLGNTNMILVVIELVIWLVSISLIYGLTLSAFELKQKDFTLLRSIGSTQRQIYFVIFIQSILLSIVPIVLSMFILYLVSLIVSTIPIYNMIDFNLVTIILNSLTVLIVVFLSYFIPARSVTHKAMIGTFDGMEFQRIYYQYKKLHQLRPFYLAWRQLVSLKKKMIIKLLLVSLVVVATMGLVKTVIVLNHTSNSYAQPLEQYKLYPRKKDKKYDIESIRKYTKSIIETDYLITGGNYTPDYFDDLSYFHSSYVYCQNEDFSDYYKFKYLNNNQLIISDIFINDLDLDLDVGSKVMFLKKEYEIIQIVDFPQQMIVLNENDYSSLKDFNSDTNQLFSIEFTDINQKSNALLECKALMELVSDSGFIYPNYSNEDIGISSLLEVDYLNILKIVCFSIVYIFQYSFELYKQREDIGSYQLLGFTRNEVASIYFCKSFIIGMIGLICGGVYFYLDIYYIYKGLIDYQYIFSVINIGLIILGAIFAIVVISFISLYPLLFILKNEGVENKYMRE